MVHSQRGFTLVEVLVAVAVFTVVSFALFGLLHEYTLTSRTLANDQHTRSDVAHLLDGWESDAASSDSVFLPDKDVLRADNLATPHEVDFYTKDSANRPYFWAYYYDAAAKTVQRYDYANPGSTAQKDGGTYDNITAFAPSLHPISEISDVTSPIYFPLLTSATNHNVALGINANVIGGTHIIHIEMATPIESIPVDLQAGGAPSGFTVVLNYTPAPKVLALKTWPIAVKYGLNNTDVADAPRAPAKFDVARVINSLLGGGVAAAAGCHAIAYTDSAMKHPDTVGDPHAAALGIAPSNVSGSLGCYNGDVVAYEPGGTAATFNPSSGSCGFSVATGAWVLAMPAATDAVTVGTGQPIMSCTLLVSDGGGAPPDFGSGIVAAQVVGACPGMVTGPSNGLPYCLSIGGTSSGCPFSGCGGVIQSATVWTYTLARFPIPTEDCSGFPSSQSCAYTDPGSSVAYCYQETFPTPGAPTTLANPAGFSCGAAPTQPWGYIPCHPPNPILACKPSGGGPPRP